MADFTPQATGASSLFSQLAGQADDMARLQAGLPDKHHVRINRRGHLHHGRTGYIDKRDGHEARVVILACVKSWHPVATLEAIGSGS